VDSLRQQAEGFKSLRMALSQSSEPIEDVAKRAFNKVFNQDIKTLLGMSDMWKSRTPPTVLDFDGIMAESVGQQVNGSNGQLQDQRELSLADCLTLFVSRYPLP
jgi:ubiquitin-like 1-activating enzyme E1 B